MAPDAELAALERRAAHLIAALSEQLNMLSAREYPTRPPLDFLEYLRKVLAGVQRLIADKPGTAMVRSLCGFLLQQAGEHVKYLATASYPQIPWPLISHIEKLLSEIAGGSQVVLRADWEFNYRIWCISEHYQQILEPVKPYFLDSVFSSPAPVWHIVSLPLIDRDNTMMHVILGHEMGHKIAEEFLAQEDAPAIEAAVRNLVDDGKWYLRDLDAYPGTAAFRIRAHLFDSILSMRSNGLTELISDVAGHVLFGPSFLLGLREFSLEDALDTLPAAPLYYPPFRYRYRRIVELHRAEGDDTMIQAMAGVDAIRDATLASFQEIIELTEANDDRDRINSDELARRAYQSLEAALPAATAFTQQRLQALAYNKDGIVIRLPSLLTRLSLGIPPAKTDNLINVDFRECLTAGAFYRTARLPIPGYLQRPWRLEDDETLNRLVNKAFEYVDVASSYVAWKAVQP